MAAVLIIEDDGLVAGYMARTLRQAGHTPILAPDARSALQEAAEQPDLILLDLGLPDLPGEELLRHLKSRAETARIPVLVITGKREAAARLREAGERTIPDILLKPVSGAQLCQAVNAALTDQQGRDVLAVPLLQQRQRELILRLIEEGPDTLVLHICRRLNADRTRMRRSQAGEVLTWAEIAEWAKRERLLDAEQASLLRHCPPAEPHEARQGAA